MLLGVINDIVLTQRHDAVYYETFLILYYTLEIRKTAFKALDQCNACIFWNADSVIMVDGSISKIIPFKHDDTFDT